MKFVCNLLLICFAATSLMACGPEIAFSAAAQHMAEQRELEKKQRFLFKSAVENKALLYNGKRHEVVSMVTKRIFDDDYLTQCEIIGDNGIRMTVDADNSLLQAIDTPQAGTPAKS